MAKRLGDLGIVPELGPVARKGAAVRLVSFEAGDPDNHLAEMAAAG